MLFIIYIDNVIKEVAEHQPLANVLAYAEDISPLDNTEENLKNHIISKFECFKQHELKLNLDKTEILNRSKITTNIYLGDIKIIQVPALVSYFMKTD